MKKTKINDYSQVLEKYLPQRVFDMLVRFGRVGDEMGFPVFIAGGIVRDMLLRRKNLDVDIVVEGDGIKYAKRLQNDMKVKADYYEKFNTAALTFENGFRVDVATARTEVYKKPAALPKISKSRMKKDLHRRDFTINAMALRINGDDFGGLMDYYKGVGDLKKKTIRILHDKSFRDDPTRIFRAVRYEQRYSFMMDNKTLKFLEDAVKLKYVDKLSGYRLRNEIIAILGEDEPGRVLKRMEKLDLLRYIHPEIKLSDKILGSMKKKSVTETGVKEGWLKNLLLLIRNLNSNQKKQVSTNLSFNSHYNNIIIK